jgi:hypothetical protein
MQGNLQKVQAIVLSKGLPRFRSFGLLGCLEDVENNLPRRRLPLLGSPLDESQALAPRVDPPEPGL